MHGYVPAWADLASDTVSPYAASTGVMAVSRLASVQRSNAPNMARGLPMVAAAPDYYAAALGLLVRAAWQETLAAAG